ncbi:MAG: carboxypeptidase regulatory-like domain-containing protein [Muribaculaceae bacterium]|uniref:TonB-dependent receptor n=7 Tax=Duncaniella TaxID=2518495 RepID=A0A4P7VZX4_9BACT|nr:carboxypeptidase regulatory-like domain-containing protein [Duncaniella sp.]MBJ2190943.1 carboxypeptidase regulatory-like domain-containing protein [Muribaculaceae bacterium]QCD41103.1 TonB-dependent receptor [Duncaniella dubosii]
MKKLMLHLLCLLATANAIAQTDVTGMVVDKESNEPITGASVIVKGADGKIKKYTTSKSDGGFTMSLPSVAGCRLEVSMMSFAKKTIFLDSVSFPLTVRLEPGSTLLKEVTVKADRIREQGDTITYNVGSFAQQQDRSIGDVLKRMPGINVESSGKIQYQGEDINKFYIEGSDLLGGKYGIATNGISHEDVGAVEVMENHQPMQVLSGISFSDKAAINLKLKNKAKATWTFHGDAGGGYSWQPEGAIWDGELFAMAVMSNFQNITTFKTNNIGEDLSAQATDFFAARRGTDLHRYVGVSLPGVPNLSRKRTLFNRSALVSTNSLWKLGRGEFKTQIDYSFNRVKAEAANITTYYLNEGNRVVTEDRNGVDRSHSLSGKLIYELNQKTAFINNTLKTNIDWDDISLSVSGSLSNNQTASLPDYYAGNDFKLIKRFNGRHLITFISKNEWESLPQTLSVSMNDGFMRQQVKDHAFYTNESATYAFSIKGITISLEGGVNGYLRSLNTGLPDMLEEIPGVIDGVASLDEETTNMLNTNYLTVYATPKFEYWVRRVNFSLNAPVSFAHYTFDKALANRSEVYFSPSLSMNWKPNNRFSMAVRGGTGRSPMNLNLIQPGYVMTNYRSFRRGVDDFYNSTSQNVSVNLSYKHTRRGMFANVFAMQSWSHNPYTLAQQLYGDYVVYSYTSAKSDGKMLMASGNIGKTLDFMRGSANINGSFSRNESYLISENNSVNSVGTSWSAGAKINGALLRWLSFDYRFDFSSSRLAMNGSNASWLGSMENEFLLNIMPHKKWEWHISGEYYRNELSTDNFKNVFLLDTKLIFKLSKRLELSSSLSNIFNQRTYNYITYNQLTSFESQRWLRGRELLISISLSK